MRLHLASLGPHTFVIATVLVAGLAGSRVVGGGRVLDERVVNVDKVVVEDASWFLVAVVGIIVLVTGFYEKVLGAYWN